MFPDIAKIRRVLVPSTRCGILPAVPLYVNLLWLVRVPRIASMEFGMGRNVCVTRGTRRPSFRVIVRILMDFVPLPRRGLVRRGFAHRLAARLHLRAFLDLGTVRNAFVRMVNRLSCRATAAIRLEYAPFLRNGLALFGLVERKMASLIRKQIRYFI